MRRSRGRARPASGTRCGGRAAGRLLACACCASPEYTSISGCFFFSYLVEFFPHGFCLCALMLTRFASRRVGSCLACGIAGVGSAGMFSASLRPLAVRFVGTAAWPGTQRPCFLVVVAASCSSWMAIEVAFNVVEHVCAYLCISTLTPRIFLSSAVLGEAADLDGLLCALRVGLPRLLRTRHRGMPSSRRIGTPVIYQEIPICPAHHRHLRLNLRFKVRLKAVSSRCFRQ